MSNVRLLPVVLIAVAGLFFIKLTHIVANNDSVIVGSSMPAQAQEAQPAPAAEEMAPEENAVDAAPSLPDEPPALVEGMKVNPNQSSRSELALLERLARRRDELVEREKSLEMREALLKAAEKRLQQRVEELKTLEGSIKLATKKREKEQEEDLGKLVAMYQAMKPKQAAKIFEVLETDVLLDIVKIMNPRKVAAIMGEMAADSAGNLSLAIATGNSLEDDVKTMGAEALPQIGN